jgi:hypothetical protein
MQFSRIRLNQQIKLSKFSKQFKNRVSDYQRVEARKKPMPSNETIIDRFKLEDLLKRRFFYDQSFAIYGGIAGKLILLNVKLISKIFRSLRLWADGMCIEAEHDSSLANPFHPRRGHARSRVHIVNAGECIEVRQVIILPVQL